MVASAFEHLTISTFQTKIIATSFVELTGSFKRAGLQWLSSNKHILHIFSNQPQTKRLTAGKTFSPKCNNLFKITSQ